MKFPQQHTITKFTLTITKSIVVGVVFIIGVIYGVLNILITKFTDTKEISKTRITSDQSKIDPKNTTAPRNSYGFPDTNGVEK